MSAGELSVSGSDPYLASPTPDASYYHQRYERGNSYGGHDSRYTGYHDQRCDEYQAKDGGDYCDDDVHSDDYSYGSYSDDYSYGSIEDDYSADDYSTGSYV